MNDHVFASAVRNFLEVETNAEAYTSLVDIVATARQREKTENTHVPVLEVSVTE